MNRIRTTAAFVAATVALLAGASAVAAPDADSQAFQRQAEVDRWQGSKSRADVQAELAAARSAGLIVTGDAAIERALLADFRTEKSRAQVAAETLEARRLGLLEGRGDRDAPLEVTPAQAEQIRQAGLRALGATVATAAR